MGFRRALSNGFSALPPDGPGADSAGWQVWNGRSRLSIERVRGAPYSPSSVLRMHFPAGWGDGNAPHQYGAPLPDNRGAVYVCTFLRASPRWTNAGNIATKFLFLRTPYQEGPLKQNHYFGFWDDDLRSGRLNLMLGLQGEGDGRQAPLSRSITSDRDLADGRWHIIEVLWIAERPAGVHNGIARSWVDGLPVHDVRDMRYFYAAQETRWTYLESVATYGNPSAHAPYALWWDVDHIYASVR